ncbi:hypothetical protein ACIL8S_12160 [Escherichia coli]|uniref:hypothetical protein n=1 Tax=Escherichia coli TaxID=562 RepID=UPI0039BCA17F
MILFCRNGTQQPVTTSTSLNTPSPTQANLLGRFERRAEIDISVKVNGSFCRDTYTAPCQNDIAKNKSSSSRTTKIDHSSMLETQRVMMTDKTLAHSMTAAKAIAANQIARIAARKESHQQNEAIERLRVNTRILNGAEMQIYPQLATSAMNRIQTE